MSRDLNKVMISGRLGRDVELKVTPTGTSVATFSVASGRSQKQPDGSYKDQTEWFRCVAWEKKAENIANLMAKGSHVMIEGRLQTRQWNDKDGQKRETTEVIVDEFYLMGPKAERTDSVESDAEIEDVPF